MQGNPLTVNGQVWFILSGNGNVSSGGGCGGPFQVGPGTPAVFAITNGVIAGGASVVGNDCIVPTSTFYRETVVNSDSTVVLTRNVNITGASADIGTLPIASPPGGGGGGGGTVTSIATTLPVTGGTCTTNCTISVATSPGGAGTVVGTTRTISTTPPLTGGGDLSLNLTLGCATFSASAPGCVTASGTATGTKSLFDDGVWRVPTAASNYQTTQVAGVAQTQRPILNFIGSAFTVADNAGATRTDLTLNQSPAGATSVVGTTRLITATAPLLIAGGASADLSADRTLSLTTSPAGQTPVGVTRTITATSPLTIGGGASADLSADRTIALTSPIPIVNGGTGSTTQNFVDLTTTQASVVGQKTLLGNNVTNTTQVGSIFANGNGAGYFEGIVGCCDPAAALGPAGSRLVQGYDGSAANPILDPGFGASDTTRPTFLMQRTTSSTATNEMSHLFTTLIKGGSGERYGLVNALHVDASGGGSGDVVGFFSTVYMDASTLNNFTSYAFWPRIDRTVTTRIVGGEIDIFNHAGVDASTSDASVNNSTIGLAINNGGTNKNSVGLVFQGTAASAFFTGIQFDTSAIATTGISFQAGSVGNYGIDFNALGAVAPFRFANDTPFLGRNAANTLDKFLMKINSADQVELDPSGTQGTKITGTIAFFKQGKSLANGLNSNIDPVGRSYVKIIGPSGAFSIGGFIPPATPEGTILYVYNAVSQTMTIVNEDVSSTAANRITTLTAANVVLRATAPSFATFIYDAGTSRWILTATN